MMVATSTTVPPANNRARFGSTGCKMLKQKRRSRSLFTLSTMAETARAPAMTRAETTAPTASEAAFMASPVYAIQRVNRRPCGEEPEECDGPRRKLRQDELRADLEFAHGFPPASCFATIRPSQRRSSPALPCGAGVARLRQARCYVVSMQRLTAGGLWAFSRFPVFPFSPAAKQRGCCGCIWYHLIYLVPVFVKSGTIYMSLSSKRVRAKPLTKRGLSVGRKQLWQEDMRARFKTGTLARIDSVLEPKETRRTLVAKAVDAEISRRLQAKPRKRKKAK